MTTTDADHAEIKAIAALNFLPCLNFPGIEHRPSTDELVEFGCYGRFAGYVVQQTKEKLVQNVTRAPEVTQTTIENLEAVSEKLRAIADLCDTAAARLSVALAAAGEANDV
jgi:hypothetical protein